MLTVGAFIVIKLGSLGRRITVTEVIGMDYWS